MASTVGLHARVTASVDKFEQGMGKAQKSLKNVEKSSKRAASSLNLLTAIEVGRTLVSGFKTLAGVVSRATNMLKGFFNEARASIDAVGKLATGLNVAVEPLQALTELAQLSGLETQQFSAGILAMNKRLGEFAMGYGPAKRALEEMGVSLADLDGKDASEQLFVIARSIMAIPDSAQRAAMAFAIFGDAGKKMMPFIEGVAGGLEKVTREGQKMGTFLSETQVRNTEEMNDAFTTMHKSIVGIGQQIVANISPGITKLIEKAKEFVKAFKFDGEVGGNALASFLTEAFLKGAVILGDWADGFIDGMVRLYQLFRVLFEKLYDFSSKALGINSSISPGGQEAEERVRHITGHLELLRENLADTQEYMATWGDMTGSQAERIKKYQREIALYESQLIDAKKAQIRAEENFLTGQRKNILGMESLGGMARQLQADYLKDKRKPGRLQQRQQPSNRPYNPRFPNFNQGAQTDPEQQTQTGLLRQIKDNTTITQVSIA